MRPGAQGLVPARAGGAPNMPETPADTDNTNIASADDTKPTNLTDISPDFLSTHYAVKHLSQEEEEEE